MAKENNYLLDGISNYIHLYYNVNGMFKYRKNTRDRESMSIPESNCLALSGKQILSYI